jgi:hypothetical protein
VTAPKDRLLINYLEKSLPGQHYICAHCIIEHNQVSKNERILFENKDADLPDFLVSAYQKAGINYPKFYKMDNLSKLGFLASEFLLSGSFQKGQYQEQETAVVLANASSSLDTDIKYFKTLEDYASPSLFVYTLPNIMIGEICIRNQFKGENAFFVFKSFDATFMADYVNNLLDGHGTKACICGWVELLEDSYQAMLLLVESKATATSVILSAENINKIYPKENG